MRAAVLVACLVCAGAVANPVPEALSPEEEDNQAVEQTPAVDPRDEQQHIVADLLEKLAASGHVPGVAMVARAPVKAGHVTDAPQAADKRDAAKVPEAPKPIGAKVGKTKHKPSSHVTKTKPRAKKQPQQPPAPGNGEPVGQATAAKPLEGQDKKALSAKDTSGESTQQIPDVGSSTSGDASNKVPFFVYEGSALDWTTDCEQSHPTEYLNYHHFKHGGEVYFAEMVKNHPWRVSDPSQAEWFVVPLLLGFANGMNGCGGRTFVEMLEVAADELSNSASYQRKQGRDHIFLTTDWVVVNGKMGTGQFELKAPIPDKFLNVAQNMVFAAQEENVKDVVSTGLRFGCAFSVPMCSQVKVDPRDAKQLREQSQDQFDNRIHSLYFSGQVDSREAYQSRAAVGQAMKDLSSSDAPGSVFVVNIKSDLEMPECQTCDSKDGTCVWCFRPDDGHYAAELRESKFGLHIRGDKPGSNRLFELIDFGSVPVVVSDTAFETTMPFPAIVPWRDMTVVVPESQVSAASLKEVVQKPRAEVEAKRAVAAQFARDVLWHVPESKVVDNVLLSAHARCAAAQ